MLAGGFAAVAQQTNAPAGNDYSSFRIIADRNIFDPNRYPHTTRTAHRTVNNRAPAFSLVGTMTYKRGMLAFFDGTDSDSRKVLATNGIINGYTVAEITLRGVRLESAGKSVEMRVGAQMRQEGKGEWKLAGAGELPMSPAADGGFDAGCAGGRRGSEFGRKRCPQKTYATKRTGTKMKSLFLKIFLTLSVSGWLMSVAAQTAPDGAPGALPPEAIAAPADETATNGQSVSAAVPTAGVQPVAPANQETAAAAPGAAPDSTSADIGLAMPAPGTNYDELSLNFRNVPLEMVLNYLSEAAGFIIVLDTPVTGTVSVISSHPMDRDEAVDLLNSVLNKNGYAAIRNGRTLTIVSKNDAKTRNIPVKTSNDPDSIPDNAEIVTQIIPIRFVEARQLVSDLSSFVSSQATIVANEAGNSIVITDTQSNIRHLTEIIRAIDNSAEGETEIRVFHLSHASPADVASELGQIFPSNNGSSGNQVQTPFRFFGGGPFGRFGGGGGFGEVSRLWRRRMAVDAAAVAQPVVPIKTQRVQKQTQVVAVAGFAHVLRHRDGLQGFDAEESPGDGANWMCLRPVTKRYLCIT